MMSIKKWIRGIMAGLVCLVLMVSVRDVAAAYETIDIGQECALIIQYEHADVSFSLYRVTDVSESGAHTLCGEFATYTDLQQAVQEGDWDEAIPTLESRILRDEISPLVEGVTEANGHYVFENLTTGLYLVTADPYVIGDITYIPMASLISLPSVGADGNWLYEVITEPKYETQETPAGSTVSVSVQKIWEDDGYESLRPNSIFVGLYQGKDQIRTVELNAANNWRHTWTELTIGYEYRVVELETPKGYQENYAQDGQVSVIINTYQAPDTPPQKDPDTPPENPPAENPPTENPSTGRPALLPDTGQLWWPVPILLAASMLCLVIGMRNHRKQG